jgi:hypothetical protein
MICRVIGLRAALRNALVTSIALVAAGIVSVSPSAADTYSFGTYDFTQSDAFGTGSFGSVAVTDLTGGTAHFVVDVTPNFLLDTGNGHHLFALSLAGGSIDASSISSSHISLASGGPFGSSPFGNFTSAFDADCTQGNCGPTLGTSFSFNVLNFAGLNVATNKYNGLDILFAEDISRADCRSDCTGVVGAPVSAVPGPVVGAGLPGLALAFGGIAAWWRRRRQLA